jgi:CBS domain-containing protein
VTPDRSIETLAREMLWSGTEQRAYPVEEDGALVGLVCLRDLRRVPQERWPDTPVREVMTPVDRLTILPIEADAQLAADALAQQDIDQIPIVRGPSERPELLGIVRRADILRWVRLTSANER